jgi:hypothetical protein
MIKLQAVHRKQIDEHIREYLKVVKPVQFISLSSIKNKRDRHRLRNEADENTFYMPSTVNVDEINFWRDEAISMGEALLGDVQRKEWSISVMFDWATFNYDCGMVVSAATVAQEDAGRKKAGEVGGARKKGRAEQQKRWVARELLHFLKTENKRHLAQEMLGQAIIEVAMSQKLPQGLSKEWLLSLIKKSSHAKPGEIPKRGVLREAFTPRGLKPQEIRAQASLPINIPPLPYP